MKPWYRDVPWILLGVSLVGYFLFLYWTFNEVSGAWWQ